MFLAAALLAAGFHLGDFAGEVEADRYPGDFNPWRVEALLGVGRVAVNGGPFATTHDAAGLTAEPGLLDDLGMAGIVDGLSRLRGRAGGRRLLGRINLAFVGLGYLALLAAFSPGHWPALAAVFLFFPLAVPEFRSPDVLAIHGALAALAVATVLGIQRVRPEPLAAAGGVLLFVLHKMRSPYGLYAMFGALAAATVLSALRRSPRPLLRPALALAVFLLLELPWTAALDARAHDPRVNEPPELRRHNVFGALVSGIGWSPNPWGLEPWDPVVSTFIARRTGHEPVPLETLASESRARAVYFSLWREAPVELAGVYLRRLPAAVARFFPLGGLGGGAWLVLGAAALGLAWRRRDEAELAAALAPQLLVLALLAQVTIVDTRPFYAHPLRFQVALAAAVSLGVLARLLLGRARLDPAPPGRGEPALTISSQD